MSRRWFIVFVEHAQEQLVFYFCTIESLRLNDADNLGFFEILNKKIKENYLFLCKLTFLLYMKILIIESLETVMLLISIQFHDNNQKTLNFQKNLFTLSKPNPLSFSMKSLEIGKRMAAHLKSEKRSEETRTTIGDQWWKDGHTMHLWILYKDTHNAFIFSVFARL